MKRQEGLIREIDCYTAREREEGALSEIFGTVDLALERMEQSVMHLLFARRESDDI